MTRSDPLRNIRIVLSGVSHPGNIGAAARAMKTMGLGRLYLVAPERFPDPEATWRAARAADVLTRAKICESLDQALAGVSLAVACTARTRELAVPQVDAREGAGRIVETARAHRVALVFGNETSGLTTAEVSKCHLIATIPASPRYSSLNVAAAVQVLAYELRMAAVDTVAAPGKAPALAGFEELERFYAHLEELMVEIGFLNPEHPKKLMPRIRRLFGRARLEKAEVNILRGVLKALSRPKAKRR